MLCRKGWKAVVVIVAVTGLLFRAEGALASDFSPEISVDSALTLTLNVPDFALINHHAAPHYLNSNSLPELLPNFPPQDLFSHRFADRNDLPPSAGLDRLTWDTLWRHAHRIPVTAVPEPATLALVAIGGALLRFHKNNFGGR
ncbi:MAG: PEP-CTERM sorting domain-containing protein [Verrucomicrobiota bacterium]